MIAHLRLWEQDRRARQREPEYQEVRCEMVSPRNGCTKKTLTMTKSSGYVKEKVGNFHGAPSLDREPQATSGCWEGKN